MATNLFYSDDVNEVEPFSTEKGSSDRSAGRVPPQALEAEQAVLGAVLYDNQTINNILEVLRAEDFYKKSHTTLFETMIELNEKGDPIDVLTLTQALRKKAQLDFVGGVGYLSHLVDSVPLSGNAQFYARVVKEMSLRRQLITQVTDIANEAFQGKGDIDNFLDSVEQRIFKVSEAKSNRTFIKVGDLVKDSIKQVEKYYISKEPITGVPSGFYDLDAITSGFQGSDLIIIAGRPSMGKTSFGLSVASHIGLESGLAVAVFSLEMSKEQIVMRLLCSEARVSSSKVRSGKLGESDFPRLVDAASKLSQADIFIDDTPSISVLEMRAKARRLHREKPLKLIMVDYLQLMRGSSRNPERREQEISEISSSLKALAKELQVPVIALSQLNRAVENRHDKRPLMADLRESGAIEQDADVIAFIYRDEVYNPESPDKGIAEIIVSKHRNGPIGTVRLAFQGEYTTFDNLAPEPSYDYLGEDFNVAEEEEELR